MFQHMAEILQGTIVDGVKYVSHPGRTATDSFDFGTQVQTGDIPPLDAEIPRHTSEPAPAPTPPTGVAKAMLHVALALPSITRPSVTDPCNDPLPAHYRDK